jgi:hypothetical protein
MGTLHCSSRLLCTSFPSLCASPGAASLLSCLWLPLALFQVILWVAYVFSLHLGILWVTSRLSIGHTSDLGEPWTQRGLLAAQPHPTYP